MQDLQTTERAIPEAVKWYRVWLAMMLARDIDAFEALLLGHPVDESRLDGDWIRWAVERRLVRLDERAIGRVFTFATGPASLPPELLCASCGGPLAEAA